MEADQGGAEEVMVEEVEAEPSARRLHAVQTQNTARLHHVRARRRRRRRLAVPAQLEHERRAGRRRAAQHDAHVDAAARHGVRGRRGKRRHLDAVEARGAARGQNVQRHSADQPAELIEVVVLPLRRCELLGEVVGRDDHERAGRRAVGLRHLHPEGREASERVVVQQDAVHIDTAEHRACLKVQQGGRTSGHLHVGTVGANAT